VLESFATKRRNKAAAKKFLKKIQKHGLPKIVITDKLPSYRVAFHELGVADRQLCVANPIIVVKIQIYYWGIITYNAMF